MEKTELDELREQISKARSMPELKALLYGVDPEIRNQLTREVYQQTEAIVARAA